ncbi:MAG: SIMPL domain-containing protein, partial [Acidobacteriaceae bacterium]|nr:SIMPL domain-containing protein [Acidobacteriaceae bacterium]
MLKRFLCLAILGTPLLSAQSERLKQQVRASGEATVTAKPDRAQISFGVLTDAPSAEVATMQNANQSTRLLDTIKRLVGNAGEVKTTGYSVAPNVQYSPNGGAPKILGYRANNTVAATVDDVSRVGRLLDAATQAGANEIGGISFTLRNDETVRAQALAEAARKARASAEAIANA